MCKDHDGEKDQYTGGSRGDHWITENNSVRNIFKKGSNSVDIDNHDTVEKKEDLAEIDNTFPDN